jgi:uroporphyrinogen decarboxylase
MTPREIVLSALRREQDQYVPFILSGFNRVAQEQFAKAAGSKDAESYFGIRPLASHVGFACTNADLRERFSPYHHIEGDVRYAQPSRRKGDYSFNEWGTAFVAGSNVAYDHFVPPAAMTKADAIEAFEKYPLPDFTQPHCHAHLDSAVADRHARGLAAVACLEMTIFEVAWQIRGFDELLADFFEHEDWANCLLDRITELSVFRARRYAQAGVDIIRCGDDVGMEDRMILSPGMWRKFLKPRLARVFRAAKEVNPKVLIFYHSDGFVEPIIGDLIEIGMDVLNPVQPECMDPAKLKKEFGSRLSFWGTIGLQHTLPFGTVDDVKAEVKERIDTVSKGGGLMLSPTHVLAPEVPFANIQAMCDAAKEFGHAI